MVKKELPRLAENHAQLVAETRSFRLGKPEIVRPEERKEMVLELARLIYAGGEQNQPEAIRLAKRLLKSDPLTDQQAGLVARFTRDWTYFTLEERLILISGDWEAIVAIFNNRPDRQII